MLHGSMHLRAMNTALSTCRREYQAHKQRASRAQARGRVGSLCIESMVGESIGAALPLLALFADASSAAATSPAAETSSKQTTVSLPRHTLGKEAV